MFVKRLMLVITTLILLLLIAISGVAIHEKKTDVTSFERSDARAYLKAKATYVCSLTGNEGIDPGFSLQHYYQTHGELGTAVASAVRSQPNVTPFPFEDCDK